jgi:N-acetylmuramoyl-L-alanine amidase
VKIRASGLVSLALALLVAVPALYAQNLKSASPYTLIARDGRRPIQAMTSGDLDLLRLDDLAAVFQLTVREDRTTNSLTVTRAGRTIVLSLDQGLASIAGKLVSLSAPPTRDGTRWLVTADFVSRALSLITDTKIEWRRASRLLVVGDVRVPRITARLEMVGSATRVTVDLIPAVPHTVSQDGRRLVIKLETDALDQALSSVASLGLVESISASEPATLIVALAASAASFRSSASPLDGGGSRVIVDVLPAGAPAQLPTQAAQPQPGATRSDPVPPLALASAPSLKTIVIDPGHGGDEIGARGVNGAMEKDITLDLARRLKASIEARLGIRVLLTRDDDRLVPLDDRASIANNNKADLFVSIHVNASPRRDARGAEVFYLSLDGLSAEAKKMAETPQGKTLPTLGGGSRDIELILWETAQARHLAESAVFAGFIEEELRKTIEMSLRPIQQASFRVLVGANMPAVLVEVGFVSNPDQEVQLVSDAYKSQVAQALYDAIVRYRARLAGAGTPPRQERD